MKYIIKILILTLILMIIFINTPIKATGIIDDAANFLEQGESGNAPFVDKLEATNTHFEDLAGFVWGIGLGVSIIATMVMGIKLMMASAEEKAEIKRSMVPYIIGVAIIFGGVTIWRILIQVLESGI